MKTEIKRLTPKEELVMLALWKLNKKVTVKEISEVYEDKKAYNTISTQVRILVKKKFVKHKPHGRGYLYYPVITQEQYREVLVKHIEDNY